MNEKERRKMKQSLQKLEELAEQSIGYRRTLCEHLVYNPEQSPDAEQWLELSESERQFLVAEHYHIQGSRYGEGPGGERLHVAFHCVIENQLALGVTDTQYDLDAMLREGISRHEAIHQLCRELSVDISKEIQKQGQQ